jgi:DNA-binding NarL/FixJ family response regulator
MSGIEGVRILHAQHRTISAVVLSVFKDGDRIFWAICAGACGYLLKETAPAKLIEALREIAEGGVVMSPEVATRLVDLFRKSHAAPSAGNLSRKS